MIDRNVEKVTKNFEEIGELTRRKAEENLSFEESPRGNWKLTIKVLL